MMNRPMVNLDQVMYQRKEFITIDDLTTYRRPRVQLHVQGIVLRDEILGTLIKTKQQQVCRAGDFLVAEIDAKVGGFGIVPSNLNGYIVSSHYFLFNIDETQLDHKFLNYYIRTSTFREQVKARGSTNYAAIRPNDVLGYKIPLPSLSEQRRIVTLALKMEELKDLQKDIVAELDALMTAILAKAFKGEL